MKRAAVQVASAAAVVAFVGYVAQFFAARWLGPEDYTTFAVFWALLFVVVSSLGGAAQEVIRVTRVAKLGMDSGIRSETLLVTRPRVGLVATVIGLSTAGVVLCLGVIGGPQLIGAEWLSTVVLLTIAGTLVGASLAVGSATAGLAQWRTYSLLVTLEGVARLVVFVGAALLAPTVLGFSIAAVLAFLPGAVVALGWGPIRRQSYSIRSDAPRVETTTRILRAMFAASLSGILVIGWPALLSTAASVNPRGSTGVSLGVLVLLVTLTRAPIMVPLTSFQNALIARFTGFDLSTRRRWVALGVCIILAVGAALAGLAALVAPPLLPILFGPAYQTGPGLVAALTAASSALGIITLTGVAAITAQRHSLYLLGWGTAIAVSLATLFLAPVPFEWATVGALVLGPLSGALVQATALRKPSS